MKFVSIVGASGAGKTTLARALCKQYPFLLAPEQHEERPFQTLFKQDIKYALANQLDYLLFRAEQEHDLRGSGSSVLIDGGLDLDFHGFTCLFHERGFLSDAEFDLCRRFYLHARTFLPLPDLIIRLYADAEIIEARLASRSRINIVSSQDADALDRLIDAWLRNLPPGRVLPLDVSHESLEFTNSIALIIKNLGG